MPLEISSLEPSKFARLENIHAGGEFSLLADVTIPIKSLIECNRGQFVLLVGGQVFEELVVFDEASIFFVVLGDHGRNGVSKSLAVDEPQK